MVSTEPHRPADERRRGCRSGRCLFPRGRMRNWHGTGTVRSRNSSRRTEGQRIGETLKVALHARAADLNAAGCSVEHQAGLADQVVL